MGTPNWSTQTIWTGDNLEIMRGLNSSCVDLIYLDPPFNSNANYAAPIGSQAAGAEFKDTWSLDDINLAWHGLIRHEHPGLYKLLDAVRTVHSDSMMSYLIYMAVRLMEMRRILKPTGSIYLHCDPTAGHYLKLLLDAVFGKNNFRNEIVWHYGKMANPKRIFPQNHDTLLRYSKTDNFNFNPIKGGESEYRNRYKRFLTAENQVLYGSVQSSSDKLVLGRVKRQQKALGRNLKDSDILFDFNTEFKIQSDVIYEPILKGNSSERTGYPTQKPVKLLERIIEASSNPSDMVFDPFCGCATACIAAERLGRKWMGIDISSLAANIVQSRMQTELGLLFYGSHRTDIPQRTDLGEIPPYSSVENRKWLYGEQGGYCLGCGHHFQMRNLTVDHIIARSRGGTDHISNLQLLCAACNSTKGEGSQAELLARLLNKGIRKPKQTYLLPNDLLPVAGS